MTDTSASEAVVQQTLEAAGLGAYEASLLVALVTLGDATASELGEEADIPRTRVYDVADSLAERGLLEKCTGKPRRYRALQPEAIIDTLSREHEDRMETLETGLSDLGKGQHKPPTDCAAWQLSGEPAVSTKLKELITECEDSLVAFLTPSPVTATLLDPLAAARERGVDVTVTTTDEEFRSRGLHSLDVRFVETTPFLEGLEAEDIVIVLLIDARAVAVVTEERDSPAAGPTFRATLCEGDGDGFVLTLRHSFESTLEEAAAESTG